jgi:hypothetical protein
MFVHTCNVYIYIYIYIYTHIKKHTIIHAHMQEYAKAHKHEIEFEKETRARHAEVFTVSRSNALTSFFPPIRLSLKDSMACVCVYVCVCVNMQPMHVFMYLVLHVQRVYASAGVLMPYVQATIQHISMVRYR